jgi:hypothetical protein
VVSQQLNVRLVAVEKDVECHGRERDALAHIEPAPLIHLVAKHEETARQQTHVQLHVELTKLEQVSTACQRIQALGGVVVFLTHCVLAQLGVERRTLGEVGVLSHGFHTGAQLVREGCLGEQQLVGYVGELGQRFQDLKPTARLSCCLHDRVETALEEVQAVHKVKVVELEDLKIFSAGRGTRESHPVALRLQLLHVALWQPQRAVVALGVVRHCRVQDLSPTLEVAVSMAQSHDQRLTGLRVSEAVAVIQHRWLRDVIVVIEWLLAQPALPLLVAIEPVTLVIADVSADRESGW